MSVRRRTRVGGAAVVASWHPAPAWLAVADVRYEPQADSTFALVEAYLRRREGEASIPSEMELERDDLPAAERLLAIFKPLEAHGMVLRGCPFHNAAVEAAGALAGVAGVVEDHKTAFRTRIIATAREAGAADPQSLGRQLAVLYEGANALAASCNDNTVFADARHAAQALIDAAVGRTPISPARQSRRKRTT